MEKKEEKENDTNLAVKSIPRQKLNIHKIRIHLIVIFLSVLFLAFILSSR
jgi:t-SNARE complex subunit (syntaxin)